MPSVTRSVPMIEQRQPSVIDSSVIEQRDPDLEFARTVGRESHARSFIAKNNLTDEGFEDLANPSNLSSSAHSPRTGITNPSPVNSVQTPGMPKQHTFSGHSQGLRNQQSQSKPQQAEQRPLANAPPSGPSNTRQMQPHLKAVQFDQPPHLRDPQPRPQTHQSPYQYPHLRDPAHPRPQTFQSAQNAPRNRQTHHQYMDVRQEGPSTSERANRIPHGTQASNHVTGNRPVPNHRREHDHNINRSQHRDQARDGQQKNKWKDPFPFQVHFLDKLAGEEVPKVEMGLADLTAREDLRQILQGLCRDTIARHELKRREDFDPDTVQLKCFGSLGSGLATLSSDLDLALVSPDSVPECSSIESEIPRLLEKRLLEEGFGARLLTRTRVPIIKFCQQPTPELAKSLLEERANWEVQRDSEPKPEEQKESPPEPEVKKDDLPKPATDLAETIKDGKSPRKCFREVSARRKPGAGEQSKPKEQAGTILENPVATAKNKEIDAPNDVVRSDEELVFLYNTAMSEGWYDVQERKLINNFLTALTKQESALDRARLQVARLELDSVTNIFHRYRAPRPEDPLKFPKEGVGIQCDINFSNHLALHNTALLKCYSVCDPRIRPMIVFVKAWAKRRKINDPYHGTLSSYGYVLMALHYLLNVADPPIAPNLQRIGKAAQDNSPENDEVIDGYGVRFWRSTDEIERLANEGMLTRNTKDSVGSLLHGFFYYFAHEGFWSPAGGYNWARDVLSLRSQHGTLFKQTKGWTAAKMTVEPSVSGRNANQIKHRYLMAIEDPFETDHNIARTVVYHGLIAIRDEFRRAHAIIESIKAEKNATPVDDLFAEAGDRDRLPRRCFGPLVSKKEVEMQRKKATDKGMQTSGPSSYTKPVIVDDNKSTPGPSLKEKSVPIHENKRNPGQSSNNTAVIHNDEPTAKSSPSNTGNQGEGSYTSKREIDPADKNDSLAKLPITVVIQNGNGGNLIAKVSSDRKRDSSNKGKLPVRSALEQARQIINAQAKASSGQSQLSIPMTGNKDHLKDKLPSTGDTTSAPNKEELVIEGAPGSSPVTRDGATPEKKRLSADDPVEETKNRQTETINTAPKRRRRRRPGDRYKNVEANPARENATNFSQHAKPTGA